jgi:hypothetical protein
MTRFAQSRRLFDGRIEKRVPTSVPVYLVSLEDSRTRERTLTENVSPQGVRVISKRSWRPGEESLITLNRGVSASRKSDLLFARGERSLLPGHGVPGSRGQLVGRAFQRLA